MDKDSSTLNEQFQNLAQVSVLKTMESDFNFLSGIWLKRQEKGPQVLEEKK